MVDIIGVFGLFPTQDACIAYLEQVRWKGRPHCPYCKSPKQTAQPKERRFHCNNCNTSYSVTVGTIFHKTHLPLQKWFMAVSLILNAKKGISARQLARDLKVHRNTAWRVSMKIREAMLEVEQRNILIGIVGMDESQIEGKSGRSVKDDDNKGGRGTRKGVVSGMVARGGRGKAKLVKRGDINLRKLAMLVGESIDTTKSIQMSDEAKFYKRMRGLLAHKTIHQSLCYGDGWIRADSVEPFWGLLKHAIIGQFRKFIRRHLREYISEFAYRFNQRKSESIFALTIQGGIGVV